MSKVWLKFKIKELYAIKHALQRSIKLKENTELEEDIELEQRLENEIDNTIKTVIGKQNSCCKGVRV